MSGYEKFLEDMLEVKEREIKAYKDFIENNLRCHIQETVEFAERIDGPNLIQTRFKVITIPQSRIIIQIDS